MTRKNASSCRSLNTHIYFIGSIRVLHTREKFGENDTGMSTIVGPLQLACMQSLLLHSRNMSDLPLLWKMVLEFQIQALVDNAPLPYAIAALCQVHQIFVTGLPRAVIQGVISTLHGMRTSFVGLLPSISDPLFPNLSCLLNHYLVKGARIRPNQVFNALALLENLLNVQDGVSVLVYSASDFTLSRALTGFHVKNSDDIKTDRDVISRFLLQSFMHAPIQQCFWCGISTVAMDLMACPGGCQSCLYCSKECQQADWVSFHHRECSSTAVPIQTGTRQDALLHVSRNEQSCFTTPCGSDTRSVFKHWVAQAIVVVQQSTKVAIHPFTWKMLKSHTNE